jgi:chemotaxis protein CheD
MTLTKLKTVGVGAGMVSNNTSETLVTYALGSCVAVAVYDAVARVGGLLHFMLPDSSLDPDKASRQPSMFADTGIPLLLERVQKIGAQTSRLRVGLAGGARMIDDNGVFAIGLRNYQAAKERLRDAGLSVDSEDVGGSVSRSVSLELATGRFGLKSSNAAAKNANPCPDR